MSQGLLDLERILYQRPERIECFVFLKVMALFVLTFMRAYAKQEGVKATEKDIQESMGKMLLVENNILPIEMKSYSIAIQSLTSYSEKYSSYPNHKSLSKC
jgi:hypothetical protein